MASALVFVDGFDKYGPVGNQNVSSVIVGEWNVSGTTPTIVASLSSFGYAIQSSNTPNMTASLSSSLTRVAGSFWHNPVAGTSATSAAWQFRNSGTAAFTIVFNGTTGNYELRTGTTAGTLLASGGSISLNTTHIISFDITVGASAAYAVYLDGVSLFSGTGNTGNGQSSVNQLNYATGTTVTHVIDNLCIFDPSQAAYDSSVLTAGVVVETQFPSGDNQTQFINDGNVEPLAGVAVRGVYRGTSTILGTTAGSIYLAKITPSVNCTLQSISFIPNVASASAKYKGVVYADSAGAPGALLDTGTEVVGTTAGSTLTLPASTPQSLTGGTSYWIGFINDTAVNIQQYDASTGLFQRKANTYASGPPSPAGSGYTTGIASMLLWANCSGASVNWPSESLNPPLGASASQIHSSTAGNEDLYTFPSLVTTPVALYGLAVKGFVSKSDGGARTVSFNTKSSTTDSTGSNAGQSLATTNQWQSSVFDTDPATGVAWTASGVNNAKSGITLAS